MRDVRRMNTAKHAVHPAAFDQFAARETINQSRAARYSTRAVVRVNNQYLRATRKTDATHPRVHRITCV